MTQKKTLAAVLLLIALVFGVYIARQPLLHAASMIAPSVEATVFYLLEGIELTPSDLERYVELQRRTSEQRGQDRIKGRTAAQEAEDRVSFERNCRAARFANTEECGRTVGYIGVLMVGFDRETGRHVDPIVLKERMIARIETNAGLSQAKKQELLAKERETLQNLRKFFPWLRVPEAHLKLMDDYRGRISEAMRQQG